MHLKNRFVLLYIMKVSEVINHIKALHTKEPSLFSLEAHKPLNAYLKNVAKLDDADVDDVFNNIDQVYITFKSLYKPNSVRNYIRLLRQTMDLDIIKSISANNQSIIDKFNAVIKQADQASHKFKTELVKKNDTIIETESLAPSENDDPPLDINEINNVIPTKQQNDGAHQSQTVLLQIELARLNAKCLCLEENNQYLQGLVQQLLTHLGK